MIVHDEAAGASATTTEYGIPIRNFWYMLLYAWNETPRSPYWKMVAGEEAPSLDALLASALTNLMQQRLRIGLGCSYMPERRLLRGIRGRVNITNSLKQRAFERGQAFCEFEEFGINAPKNRIVRTTLMRLAQTGSFGQNSGRAADLRRRIRWLVRALDGVDLIELTPSIIHREQMQRQDHDYQFMLAICDFILARRMPTEQTGQAFKSQLERKQYTLHSLYQNFVTNFYRHHLQDWIVRREAILDWHAKDASSYLPQMRPDLILTEKGAVGRMIVLDTKFTAKSLIPNQWGRTMFNPSHLYQIYAYLRTQEHLSKQSMEAIGILLYPTIEEELSEKIALPFHMMHIECVNLAAPWQDIEQRLIEVITDV